MNNEDNLLQCVTRNKTNVRVSHGRILVFQDKQLNLTDLEVDMHSQCQIFNGVDTFSQVQAS